MKNIKYLLAFLVGILLTTACQNGYIDSIKAVAAGADTTPPAVTINYPFEGKVIQVKEEVTSINIQLKVTDDIEIASIVVNLDGTDLTTFTSFLDYRIAIEQYLFTNLTNGNHVLKVTATDKTGKTTSSSVNFSKTAPYIPKYDGEVFYMPFEGDFMEEINLILPTVIGTPGFATGQKGKAYAGAADSYLAFPTTGLQNSGFSVVLWYKLNATVFTRAGIITISPPNTSGFDASRTHGLRFFHEGPSSASQQFKLNVGTGSSESWNNGGAVAGPISDWVHLAFTISPTSCVVYINGVAMETDPVGGPIDWTGCSSMSIGSGAPYFIDWGHLSDNSQIDELRIFNKAITAAEVQTIYNDQK